MIKITLLMLPLMFSFHTANASGNFSWYEYQNSQTKVEAKKVIMSPDGKTKKMIWDRYGVPATKKSIKDRMEERSRSALNFGVMMNNNPSYITQPTELDLLGQITGSTTEATTSTASLSNFAFYAKGLINFEPIGVNTSNVYAMITLSNDSIDFDLTKRLLGSNKSTLSLDLGAGAKVVSAANAVFEKGFHPYAVSSINIDTDSYIFSLGAKMMFKKPSVYQYTTDRITPYLSTGFKF